MREIKANPCTRTTVARQGEHGVTIIHFPVADMLALGSGSFELWFRRPDGRTAPQINTLQGPDLLWTPELGDTFVDGFASAEIRYFIGDDLAISRIYPLKINKTTIELGSDPGPEAPWVEQVHADAVNACKCAADAEISAAEAAAARDELLAQKGQPDGIAPLGPDGKIPGEFVPKDTEVFTATITSEVGRLVCDMTAREIIDASRKGVVKAEYTDDASGETREYYYFKQMPDGRAVFTKDGYIENGVPKQTLFYVDFAGNVEVETRTPDAVTAFATCNDAAAPEKFAPNTWYVPKTMPKPSGAVGMMLDVFWVNGKVDGIGYDVRLVWGAEGEPDNVEIVGKASTTDGLTGAHSIPAEGTVRYQLEESGGRKRWRYVSGPLIPTEFSTDTAAATADKAVHGLAIGYLPGMEIYVQMDAGNTADVMRLVPDEGETLPVYGNGTGAKTGAIPAGYILHLKNAGDHWQIINAPEQDNVKFTPQSLTPEQQEQARKNIGADEGEWKIIEHAVLADKVTVWEKDIVNLKKAKILLYTPQTPEYASDFGIAWCFYENTAGRALSYVTNHVLSHKANSYIAFASVDLSTNVLNSGFTTWNHVEDSDFRYNPMAFEENPGQSFASYLPTRNGVINRIVVRCYGNAFLPKKSEIYVLGVRA